MTGCHDNGLCFWRQFCTYWIRCEIQGYKFPQELNPIHEQMPCMFPGIEKIRFSMDIPLKTPPIKQQSTNSVYTNKPLKYQYTKLLSAHYALKPMYECNSMASTFFTMFTVTRIMFSASLIKLFCPYDMPFSCYICSCQRKHTNCHNIWE